MMYFRKLDSRSQIQYGSESPEAWVKTQTAGSIPGF